VRREEVQLQVPELLGKALAGVRLVEGQPFEVPAGVLDKLGKGDFTPRRVVLTYRGKTPEGARIDAVAALVHDRSNLKMFFDLTAEIVIDETGWCRSNKTRGQVRTEFKGVVVGSGAGSAQLLATPLR